MGLSCAVPPPTPRKMKKFIRYLRLKRGRATEHESVKRKQRYEGDFTLEPFAGLTPEYMEMSECGNPRFKFTPSPWG